MAILDPPRPRNLQCLCAVPEDHGGTARRGFLETLSSPQVEAAKLRSHSSEVNWPEGPEPPSFTTPEEIDQLQAAVVETEPGIAVGRDGRQLLAKELVVLEGNPRTEAQLYLEDQPRPVQAGRILFWPKTRKVEIDDLRSFQLQFPAPPPRPKAAKKRIIPSPTRRQLVTSRRVCCTSGDINMSQATSPVYWVPVWRH